MTRDITLREVMDQVMPEQGADYRIVVFPREVIAGIGLKRSKGFMKGFGPVAGRELKGKGR